MLRPVSAAIVRTNRVIKGYNPEWMCGEGRQLNTQNPEYNEYQWFDQDKRASL